MRVIKFTAENGFCPYCIVGDTKYYIQDHSIGGGKYEYTLMSRPTTNTYKRFLNEKEALKFIHQEIGRVPILPDYRYDDFEGFETKSKYYTLHDGSKNIVKIIDKPIVLSGCFDSYQEILEYAKEYLNSFQSSLF